MDDPCVRSGERWSRRVERDEKKRMSLVGFVYPLASMNPISIISQTTMH